MRPEDGKPQKNSLLKSFGCALRGVYLAFWTERNFKIYPVGIIIAVGCGIYVGLPALQWCLVIFAIGFVLAAEMINTAIERLGDEVAGGKLSRFVGEAKDIAAGAVVVACVTAIVIAVIVLFIPLARKWWG